MPSKNLTAKASPHKRFFAYVLIKDIKVIDALVELVDNAMDAVKHAKKSTTQERIFNIDINLSADEVSVSDDASGISIHAATEYVFCFGRSEQFQERLEGLIGGFGIGMKRAFFKVGNHFQVTSRTTTEAFQVDVDISSWLDEGGEADPTSWSFPLTVLDTATLQTPPATGTIIKLTELDPSVSSTVTNQIFVKEFTNRLQEAHGEALDGTIIIKVNGTPISVSVASLLVSDEVPAQKEELQFEVDGKSISASIVAGFGEGKEEDMGWYVYCNGRMILRADQSQLTGWKDTAVRRAVGESENTDLVAQPHWQFRRFRGFVFFESQHVEALPWNSTKTGLNPEAPAYRRIRQKLVDMLRAAVTLLNKVEKQPEQKRAFEAALKAASPQRASAINIGGTIQFVPRKPVKAEIPQTTISYKIPTNLATQVREALGLTSWPQVGLSTFRYYVENEEIGSSDA